MIAKELRPHFTLEILNEYEIDNNDAEYLAYCIETATLSRLVFKNLIFSAFWALQVARALRTVPHLIADKLYFEIFESSDFLHAIELIDYFDLIDKKKKPERMEIIRDSYWFAFSFLLPDSTTVKWGFEVDVGINDADAQHVAVALCSNSSVKGLTFSYCYMKDVEAKTLAKVLDCNTILEELDLSDNGIGSIGAEALAPVIELNTALKKLDLSSNDVGDVGAKALSEVLNYNTILEELDLSENEIGDVGAEVLAKAVGSNAALEELVLFCNNVGDVGAIALAEALDTNTSLKSLVLSQNCIGDRGAKAFAEALHHNSTITHLGLCANKDIGEEGVHHLIQALTVNDSISENGLTLDIYRKI